MKFNKILLIIIIIFLFMKFSEGFTNFSDLQAYDINFIENDKPKIKDFRPKKTSNLIGYCDEKRNQCITY